MSTTPLYPLAFEPYLRPMPWGGDHLAQWVEAPLPPDKVIGEAWLLSDHHAHNSRVANGPLAGWTLRRLMQERAAELLGYDAGRFPLLVKIVDARENLSVQVHPDDAEARRWAPAEGGKTEAWYVLEADPEAVIYLGLKPGVDKATLARELPLGTVPLCLQRHEPRPGQCYLVPAGTVHALGGNLVVLEVQQTSDATFRLYDWGRVDAAGKPRPLHIEAALACLKEQPTGAGLKKPQPLPEGGERLAGCEFFAMDRLAVTRQTPLQGPCILIGLQGQAELTHGVDRLSLRPGGTVLIPAVVTDAVVEPYDQYVMMYVTLGTD
jgi:mannose-6-phosphate isomerase